MGVDLVQPVAMRSAVFCVVCVVRDSAGGHALFFGRA